MVVNRPRADSTACCPVDFSTKQPVPYVFFAMPGVKQAWPNKAACWSPAAPAIGTSRPKKWYSAVTPYTSEEERTSGSMEAGMPRISNSSSSQRSSWILYSSVRDALDGSVT
ncbi:hypothetical protein D3C81_1958690 [compost metagenome]